MAAVVVVAVTVPLVLGRGTGDGLGGVLSGAGVGGPRLPGEGEAAPEESAARTVSYPQPPRNAWQFVARDLVPEADGEMSSWGGADTGTYFATQNVIVIDGTWVVFAGGWTRSALAGLDGETGVVRWSRDYGEAVGRNLQGCGSEPVDGALACVEVPFDSWSGEWAHGDVVVVRLDPETGEVLGEVVAPVWTQQAIVVDGDLVLGAYDWSAGRFVVQRMTSDGTVVWETERPYVPAEEDTQGDGFFSMEVLGGGVVAASAGGYVDVDLADGSVLVEPARGWVTVLPQGLLAASVGDTGVDVLDAEGTYLFSLDGYTTSPAIIEDPEDAPVFAYAYEQPLTAHAASDGALLWEGEETSYVTAVLGDTALVVSGDDSSQVSALDLTTGTRRWAVSLGEYVSVIGWDGERVMVLAAGTLSALDVEDGTIVWQRQVGEDLWSGLVVERQLVLYGANGFTVQAAE